MALAVLLGSGAGTVGLAGPAWAAPPGPAAAPSPFVVVYNSSVTNVNTETNTLVSQLGFATGFRYTAALDGFSAALTPAQVTQLQANPAVAYVEPDQTITTSGMQTLAKGETLPVGIERIGAATTTQVHTASGVNVAVLDTGIDLNNSDLNAVSGTNCITPGTSAQDDNGHGTNVAGIIAAKDQGAGVVGVAPGTKLYAVKVMSKAGTGTLSQILCGINWVTANAATLNIKVANLSFTGSGSNDSNCGNTNKDAEHQAICKSVAAGVTYVTSAGNSSADFANYIPASYPEVLTVTAMTSTNGIPGGTGPAPNCTPGQKDGTYATYSNYAGSTAEQAHTIAAPGTCVVSDQLGGGTSTYWGTSQAAPAVAGTVALCINDNGVNGPCAGLTPAQIIAKIRSQAASYATGTNGYTGDPLHAVTGKYFGYLDYAGAY